MSINNRKRHYLHIWKQQANSDS